MIIDEKIVVDYLCTLIETCDGEELAEITEKLLKVKNCTYTHGFLEFQDTRESSFHTESMMKAIQESYNEDIPF